MKTQYPRLDQIRILYARALGGEEDAYKQLLEYLKTLPKPENSSEICIAEEIKNALIQSKINFTSGEYFELT